VPLESLRRRCCCRRRKRWSQTLARFPHAPESSRRTAFATTRTHPTGRNLYSGSRRWHRWFGAGSCVCSGWQPRNCIESLARDLPTYLREKDAAFAGHGNLTAVSKRNRFVRTDRLVIAEIILDPQSPIQIDINEVCRHRRRQETRHRSGRPVCWARLRRWWRAALTSTPRRSNSDQGRAWAHVSGPLRMEPHRLATRNQSAASEPTSGPIVRRDAIDRGAAWDRIAGSIERRATGS